MEERFSTNAEAKKRPTGAIARIYGRIDRFNKLANKIKDRYQSEDRVIPLTRLINTIQQEYPDIVGKEIDSYEELDLIYLYHSLRLELKNCQEEAMLFKPIEVSVRRNEPQSHFGMPDSEAMVQQWVEVYSRLVKKGWLRSNETESGDWVYTCCGKGIKPNKTIVWHSTNAALAYIVRTKFNGNWDVAINTFRKKDGSEYSRNLQTANDPAEKVVREIDAIFKKQ